MAKMSEAKTRKDLIDPILFERVGWKKEYIIEEPNAVKSNFKTKEFKYIGDEIEEGENRFIDYLLLDEQRNPLAIIEAKKPRWILKREKFKEELIGKMLKNKLGLRFPFF